MEKAKLGESLPNDTVIRMARLFKDELTLANIPRPQLVSMCQFMGLSPYGADAFLRFQVIDVNVICNKINMLHVYQISMTKIFFSELYLVIV